MSIVLCLRQSNYQQCTNRKVQLFFFYTNLCDLEVRVVLAIHDLDILVALSVLSLLLFLSVLAVPLDQVDQVDQ